MPKLTDYARGEFILTGSGGTIRSSEAGAGGSGTHNFFTGSGAGSNNTSGSRNIFLGENAGSTNTIGSNNIAIGDNAGVSDSAVSNELTLGNASISRFRIPGIQSTANNQNVLLYDSAEDTLVLGLAPPSFPISVDFGLITEAPAAQVFPTATITVLTQAEYDALGSYDNSVLYVISG